MWRIVLIFILLISSKFGLTCSCGPLSMLNINDVENAKFIFIGKAIEVKEDTTGLKKIITFTVSDDLKGTKKGQLIQIVTNNNSAACGLDIKEGESWYIFSSYLSNYDNLPSVSLCGRSVRLTKRRYKFREFGFTARYYRKAYRQNYRRFRGENKLIENL